ncbi:SDR family oxidoreductase [Sphingomonas oligophenolica]|uniref:SDR family oxidoreductase n=1 Tax=Sphingomonas oligophenolica TaxID=301154 RepID=A0ABU9Y6C8_9SPHN
MLEGKVVAVTGGGRGVGRSVALACASAGAKVVVNDLGSSESGDDADAGPARDVVDEITAAGGTAIANTASVMEPEGATSIIEDAVRHFGRIDGVVNNAGFLRDAMFYKMSLKDWTDVIQVHLNGSYYVSRAAANYFKEQGSGAYVHFTSTSGVLGNIGQTNYSAAKAGIVQMSYSIALEMAKFGVRSNCIAPTAWTRLLETIPIRDEAHRIKMERMKAMLGPEKIAPLVVYLMSDDARNVSGQTFGVRNNEVFLYSRPTILRTMQMSDGWTPESIAEILMPALRPSFPKLAKSADVIAWESY